jgi:hypothetical protein
VDLDETPVLLALHFHVRLTIEDQLRDDLLRPGGAGALILANRPCNRGRRACKKHEPGGNNGEYREQA